VLRKFGAQLFGQVVVQLGSVTLKCHLSYAVFSSAKLTGDLIEFVTILSIASSLPNFRKKANNLIY
jgi:hypothetical protein